MMENTLGGLKPELPKGPWKDTSPVFDAAVLAADNTMAAV